MLLHDRGDEIEIFRRKADSFLAGEITEDAFRPFRLKHGIYGQRQPGVQMVRCKIPGGLLTSAQVDRLGLLQARHLATAGAVAGLKVPAEYLLVDAWDVPQALLPQMAVVRGDRTCASIMAASIVAKVARDAAMIEFDRLYPGWGFADHKGYATPAHRLAIRRLGPSPIHRTSWAPFREPALLG